MNYLSITLLLVCLSLQSGIAQVKKQYLDSKNAETTVVIKEKNASDVAILNNQFNINDVGMGEVIMIKTDNLAPKGKPETKPTTASATNPVPRTTTKSSVAKQRHFSGSGSTHKVKTKKRKMKKRKSNKKRNRRSCFSF